MILGGGRERSAQRHLKNRGSEPFSESDRQRRLIR